MSHKKYLPVVVLILAVVAAGVFLLRSSSKPALSQPQVEKTASTTEWITYHGKEGHYRFDYPATLEQNPDSLPPSVELFHYPIQIDVTTADATVYQNSLDVFLKELIRSGAKLEKRIKIDGFDAIVTSYPDKPDVLFAEFIKGDTQFGIRTEGLDHERVWSSFHFEE
jgi:hypothetical protein